MEYTLLAVMAVEGEKTSHVQILYEENISCLNTSQLCVQKQLVSFPDHFLHIKSSLGMRLRNNMSK